MSPTSNVSNVSKVFNVSNERGFTRTNFSEVFTSLLMSYKHQKIVYFTGLKELDPFSGGVQMSNLLCLKCPEGKVISPGSSSSPALSSGISSSAMLVWYEASSVLASTNKKMERRSSFLSAPPIPKEKNLSSSVPIPHRSQRRANRLSPHWLLCPPPPLASQPLAWSSVRGEAARARARCRANRSDPRKGKKSMVDPKLARVKNLFWSMEFFRRLSPSVLHFDGLACIFSCLLRGRDSKKVKHFISRDGGSTVRIFFILVTCSL